MTVEMNTYEGVCKYCGNVQPIMAMDQTDANEKISENCDCGGAELERKKQLLLQNIKKTIGRECVDFGLRQVSKEQEELITGMALAVLHGWIESASCKFEGTTVTIKETGGKIKLQRTDTKKAERSA